MFKGRVVCQSRRTLRKNFFAIRDMIRSMKTRDIQKILSLLHDVASSALDHVADQLADGAAELGDELSDLTDLGKSWKKLSKAARSAFIEQLLKSAALVIATTVATRLGVSMAGK